jgi:xylulokinase
MQVLSDIAHVEQHLPRETIGASYGDALLAAIGAGLVPPDTDWSHTARVVTPAPRDAAVYDELFDLYCRLYPATAAVVHRLASLQERAAADSTP